MVNLKTKNSGDGCPKKAIEKTILRFLGPRTFSHGLHPLLPFVDGGKRRPRVRWISALDLMSARCKGSLHTMSLAPGLELTEEHGTSLRSLVEAGRL